MKIIYILSKSVILFLTNGLVAQVSNNCSGGNLNGSNGSISYSIGQVCYTSDSNTFGTVSKGVQQAFEVYSLNLDESNKSNISVFPNPTIQEINLCLNQVNSINSTFSYELYDANGKLIESDIIHSNYTCIQFKNHSTGTYFLKVFQENALIQNFKLIKN